MARPRRQIVPLDAEATGNRIEAEAPDLAIVPEIEPETPLAPKRTSARQQLADAIATVRALEAEIVEAEAAVNAADAAEWQTGAALRDAEEALELAKPRPYGGVLKPREPYTFASAEEADAYNAKLNEPPPSIEDAKAAVARATDARDSARATAQFHKGRLDQVTARLRWKRSSIDEALRLAVHFDPATAALAAETKRLATAAAASRRAFELAVGGGLLQSDHLFYRATEPTDVRTDHQGWAILHRWREALEALATNPDAPLPTAG